MKININIKFIKLYKDKTGNFLNRKRKKKKDTYNINKDKSKKNNIQINCVNEDSFKKCN